LNTAASGVGHAEEEEPFSAVRRADFRRREQSALNPVTQSLKVIVHATRTSAGEHTADVLNKDRWRPALDEYSSGV
jgi:hypothetical protein